MSLFRKREYIIDDLNRWFEGAVVFSNTQNRAGFVNGVHHNEGDDHVYFELRGRPRDDDDDDEDEEENNVWTDEDVETGFQTYGAIQLGPDAIFASRMPMRQYSFGLKTRQFQFYGMPGGRYSRNVDVLKMVEQFHNRTTYSVEAAIKALAEGKVRGCVLNDDLRMLRLYKRGTSDALYALVYRDRFIGEVTEEGEFSLVEAVQPFQKYMLDGVQLSS